MFEMTERSAIGRTRNLSPLRAGERTNAAGRAIANKVLLSIPERDFHRVRPFLEFIPLRQHLSLHEPSERLRYVYFINRGLVSIVVATERGREVEAGVIGFEGVVGTGLAVGVDRSPLRQVVQIEGEAFRTRAGALAEVLDQSPDLRLYLSRYAVLQGMQVAQTAACNRLHGVAKRLARWLLMAQDRVGKGTLPITHDFLATMLGTGRPTVSLAARALRHKKAIHYSRGAVQILDRKKLEASACSCYRVIQQLNGELGLM